MDPYMQFCLNGDSSSHELDTGTDNRELAMINPGANHKKKKTRGYTQMREIWGRREGEALLKVKCNEYGQPNDKVGTILSNFIGTLIRDGKNAPLTYKNWHEVPKDYKERMWNLLKTKFDLNESSKHWTMQKFGRKLKEWRGQLKRKYKEGEAFEEQKNKVGGRKPTRAELFKIFYTKKDGTQSSYVKTKITAIEKEVVDASSDSLSRNDAFAKVMGPDKNGRVRMLGGGVCPTLAFNDISSREANQNSAMKILQQQNNELRKELEQFKSQGVYVPEDVYVPRHEIVDSDPTQPGSNDLSPIVQIANREDWSLDASLIERPMEIGSTVCLKSILFPTNTIAIGVLYSMDPSKEVNGQELGQDHWEIWVQVATKPDERLVRSCGQHKTIGHVVADHIAWPKKFVILKDLDARMYLDHMYRQT